MKELQLIHGAIIGSSRSLGEYRLNGWVSGLHYNFKSYPSRMYIKTQSCMYEHKA